MQNNLLPNKRPHTHTTMNQPGCHILLLVLSDHQTWCWWCMLLLSVGWTTSWRYRQHFLQCQYRCHYPVDYGYGMWLYHLQLVRHQHRWLFPCWLVLFYSQILLQFDEHLINNLKFRFLICSFFFFQVQVIVSIDLEFFFQSPNFFNLKIINFTTNCW